MKIFWSFLLLALISNVGSAAVAPLQQHFTGPTSVNIESYPKKLVVADLRQIGFDDLLTVNWEIDGNGWITRLDGHKGLYGRIGLITVRLNQARPNSVGSFFPPQYLEFGDDLPCVSCNFQNDLVAMNVNDDAFPDLVALNGAGKRVDVFLNDGKGVFNQQQVIVSPVEGSTAMGDPGNAPAFLASGDFDGDHIQDIAVEYIDSSWGARQIAISVLYGDGRGHFATRLTNGKEDFWHSSAAASGNRYPGFLSILGWNWGTPYYSIENGNGSHHQLVTIPGGQNRNDKLAFRADENTVIVWDPLHRIQINVDSFHGPFTAADIDGDGIADLVGQAGSAVALGPAFAKVNYSDFDTGVDGAVVEDFDQDGRPDVARVVGWDPKNLLGGGEMWVAYGDGTKPSPLSGKNVTKQLYVAPRWWENPLSIATGDFQGQINSITREAIKDIAVLGATSVTIYPNAGEKTLVDPVSIKEVIPAGGQRLTLPPPNTKPLVQLVGTFRVGTAAQVQTVFLKGDPTDAATKGLIYVFLALKTTKGAVPANDQVEFDLTENTVVPGAYTLFATNASPNRSNEIPYRVYP